MAKIKQQSPNLRMPVESYKKLIYSTFTTEQIWIYCTLTSYYSVPVRSFLC